MVHFTTYQFHHIYDGWNWTSWKIILQNENLEREIVEDSVGESQPTKCQLFHFYCNIGWIRTAFFQFCEFRWDIKTSNTSRVESHDIPGLTSKSFVWTTKLQLWDMKQFVSFSEIFFGKKSNFTVFRQNNIVPPQHSNRKPLI